MKRLLLFITLVGCKNASDVASRMYPGLTCFGQKDDYALCVNMRNEQFVCFASESADTAFCLRAVSKSELTGL